MTRIQPGMPERRARIAFFLPHLGHGGAERVVLQLLNGLDRGLFSPLLILQKREGDYLRDLDAAIEVLELRRRRPPGCVLELSRILKARQVDLVYTATNATNIYAAIAARLAGRAIRVVISEHTPLAFSLGQAKLRPLRRMGIRFAYPRADLMVAPLDQIGDETRAFLGEAAPAFRALPNPVIEAMAAERTQPDVALRIAGVGRLAAVKRFDLLIAAFAAFHRDRPGASLTLYGDGPERGRLEDCAARLGVGEAVHFAGYVDDVPARLSDSDLFVCSSQREGFGNAIVEAMAAGVPVVSVDCPFGPRVLLQDGAAGRLVREADPASLAAAMSEVAADVGLRTRYAAAGRETARPFTVARAVGAYSQAFLDLLHRAANRDGRTARD